MVKSRPYVILSAAITLDGKLGISGKRTKLSSKSDKIRVHKLRSKGDAIIIGKNTVEALRSGFYWGYSGLINNIILKIERETKKKYKIIFTGGFADLFKTSITRPFVIDKNITINGIAEIFKENRNYLIK